MKRPISKIFDSESSSSDEPILMLDRSNASVGADLRRRFLSLEAEESRPVSAADVQRMDDAWRFSSCLEDSAEEIVSLDSEEICPSYSDMPREVVLDPEVPEVPAVPTRGRFRLCAKKLALTFPQCSVDPQVVVDRVKDRFGEDGIKWVIVSRENHADGHQHLHVGLWLKSTFDSRSHTCFDFLTVQHGNYKVMDNVEGWIAYIIKDGDFVAWGIDPIVYLQARKRKKSVSFLTVAQLIQGGQTVRQVDKLHPGFALQHLSKMRAYEAFTAQGVAQEELRVWKELPVVYPTPQQSRVAIWLNGNIKKTRAFGSRQLMICGPTGRGKTSLVLALMKYLKVYFVPMGETFYDNYSDKDFDLIVFDEYRSQKTIQWMNAFVQGAPIAFRRKGGQGLKLKNLPCILLSNYLPTEMYSKVAAEKPGILDTFLARWDIVSLANGALQGNAQMNLYSVIDELLKE